jgi:hypothetical protein
VRGIENTRESGRLEVRIRWDINKVIRYTIVVFFKTRWRNWRTRRRRCIIKWMQRPSLRIENLIFLVNCIKNSTGANGSWWLRRCTRLVIRVLYAWNRSWWRRLLWSKEESSGWHGWQIKVISCIVEDIKMAGLVTDIAEYGATDDRMVTAIVEGTGMRLVTM